MTDEPITRDLDELIAEESARNPEFAAGVRAAQARLTLRDLIAEKIGNAGTAIEDLPGDVAPALADAVMELFPDVGVEDWLIATMPGPSGDVEVREQIRRPHMPVTHHRYVLRTVPEPVEETP